ncbi:immune-induced peptide 23 [Drosophila erecta]|uniref:Bomanin bicipital 3 n=1 Tax=Drosophila erecta TaxID=7220 RepID=B3NMQ9_DROER|nr:immune-induced peptide 23 [Drosophila erecta]EDV55063.1 uncharacterized protein Dere_GG20975 [Drosophila erecta]
MKSLTLLALLFLATLAFVHAGKVSINGKCVNCSHDQTTTTTTRKPSTGKGGRGRTTAKPSSRSPPARGRSSWEEDDDDDLAGGWSLHQSAGGTQYIGRRSKRQLRGGQYIDLGGSGGRGGGGGGGWAGSGITTIDSSGYPGGTLVRNSDCVGCNIRG